MKVNSSPAAWRAVQSMVAPPAWSWLETSMPLTGYPDGTAICGVSAWAVTAPGATAAWAEPLAVSVGVGVLSAAKAVAGAARRTAAKAAMAPVRARVTMCMEELRVVEGDRGGEGDCSAPARGAGP